MSLRYDIAGYEIMGNERLIGEAVDQALAEQGSSGGLVTEDVRRSVAAKVMGRSALVLKETKPDKSRVFPLGFESSAPVAAGASITIKSRPQVLFRGERLVLPSDIAGSFVIDDVKVGKDSQFVAEGPIPGRVLQENAVGVGFQLDTAQISQDISIAATNISGAPATFRAALIGTAAE